jgi:hypothetical protein
LAQLAKERNREPLPPVPEKYGLRLPPDRHCLTAVNFQLIPEVNSYLIIRSHLFFILVQDSRIFFFTILILFKPLPGYLQKEDSPSNIEISQILPEDNDDDMMEVLPYNNNIVREGSDPVTTSVTNAESDYDMHESPEQTDNTTITTTAATTNNDWKRNRPEDDDYDF